MRTKHLVMALALPTLFAACQDQDYLSNPTNNLKGQFIKLEKGFALQGGYNDVSTRGQWDVVDGKAYFAWRPNQESAGATTYTPDQIGLAWTGVCLDKDGNYVATGSAVATADDRVFTNYKFNHFAWKINGEEIVEDKCNPGTYTSGVKLVNGFSDGVNTLAAAYSTANGEVQYTASPAVITPANWPTYNTTEGEANGSEGLFNTSNSTVYAGQYIVYAPYDAKNVSNYIAATSKDNFEISQFETEANRAKTLNKFSNEIFKYGNTTIVDGGTKTTKFATENLNGYIGIKLTSATTPTIKKVIIYDETGKNLLTKVGLSANGILANKSGKDIYLNNATVAKEYTQTITAVINGGTGEALTAAPAYVAIPALPTEGTISSLKVVLINDANIAVEKEFNNITIERNKFANGTWLDFSGIDFTKGSLLATDEASLKAAVTAQNTLNRDGIVKILGNIKLSDSYDVEAAITNSIKVTITGGKIIVPANNASQFELTLGSNVIVNSNIDVMNTCCLNNAGKLVVKNATLGGIVNIGAADPDGSIPTGKEGNLEFIGNKTSIVNGTINNYGHAVLTAGASSTDITQVNVNGTINNYNELKITKASVGTNKDAKLFILDNGTLNNKTAATTTIEGVLAVAGTASNDGIVVDKISSQVTGNIYELASPGEYISEVDNPGERFTAALTARPTTTVKFVGDAQTYDLKEIAGANVRKTIKTYVVEETGAGTVFKTTSASTINASMKNLIVNSLLTLTNGAKLNLKVTEKATINAAMTITAMAVADKDNQCLGVKDLIVNAGGSLAVGKYVRSMMETLTVNPATVTPVAAAGKITFDFSSQTFVSGLINILGTADIIQATGSTSGEVAGDVWYKETKPQGAENWLHGIPTKFGGETWPTK